MQSMLVDAKHVAGAVDAHKEWAKGHDKHLQPANDPMREVEPFLDCLVKTAAWDHMRESVDSGVF